eukprot:1840319-Alexandrium_andersonii.AAC.1
MCIRDRSLPQFPTCPARCGPAGAVPTPLQCGCRSRHCESYSAWWRLPAARPLTVRPRDGVRHAPSHGTSLHAAP